MTDTEPITLDRANLERLADRLETVAQPPDDSGFWLGYAVVVGAIRQAAEAMPSGVLVPADDPRLREPRVWPPGDAVRYAVIQGRRGHDRAPRGRRGHPMTDAELVHRTHRQLRGERDELLTRLDGCTDPDCDCHLWLQVRLADVRWLLGESA